MKFAAKMAVFLLIFLSIHLMQEVTLNCYVLSYPRLTNPQPTNDPTRILAEVQKDYNSTTNPIVVIDFQKKSISRPLAEDNPIVLPSPQKITANYTFNLTCDIPRVFWKVFAPNGSILIDQKAPIECWDWPEFGFSCFVSEPLNCAFLCYYAYNYTVHILISSFGINSSKLIKTTQIEILAMIESTEEWLWEVDRSEYGISDMPIIYDEERLVMFQSSTSRRNKELFRFSIENGLEYLASLHRVNRKIWNIQTKQLIILGGRSAELISYNSSQEIETINITFSEAQLSNFLSKPLSFPPLQVSVIVLALIILFLKIRR
ncbi:MAG: hypothetical protein ACFE95_10540 [Candidatus Hodarchaeota archaeon]